MRPFGDGLDRRSRDGWEGRLPAERLQKESVACAEVCPRKPPIQTRLGRRWEGSSGFKIASGAAPATRAGSCGAGGAADAPAEVAACARPRPRGGASGGGGGQGCSFRGHKPCCLGHGVLPAKERLARLQPGPDMEEASGAAPASEERLRTSYAADLQKAAAGVGPSPPPSSGLEAPCSERSHPSILLMNDFPSTSGFKAPSASVSKPKGTMRASADKLERLPRLFEWLGVKARDEPSAELASPEIVKGTVQPVLETEEGSPDSPIRYLQDRVSMPYVGVYQQDKPESLLPVPGLVANGTTASIQEVMDRGGSVLHQGHNCTADWQPSTHNNSGNRRLSLDSPCEEDRFESSNSSSYSSESDEEAYSPRLLDHNSLVMLQASGRTLSAVYSNWRWELGEASPEEFTETSSACKDGDLETMLCTPASTFLLLWPEKDKVALRSVVADGMLLTATSAGQNAALFNGWSVTEASLWEVLQHKERVDEAALSLDLEVEVHFPTNGLQLLDELHGQLDIVNGKYDALGLKNKEASLMARRRISQLEAEVTNLRQELLRKQGTSGNAHQGERPLQWRRNALRGAGAVLEMERRLLKMGIEKMALQERVALLESLAEKTIESQQCEQNNLRVSGLSMDASGPQGTEDKDAPCSLVATSVAPADDQAEGFIEERAAAGEGCTSAVGDSCFISGAFTSGLVEQADAGLPVTAAPDDIDAVPDHSKNVEANAGHYQDNLSSGWQVSLLGGCTQSSPVRSILLDDDKPRHADGQAAVDRTMEVATTPSYVFPVLLALPANISPDEAADSHNMPRTWASDSSPQTEGHLQPEPCELLLYLPQPSSPTRAAGVPVHIESNPDMLTGMTGSQEVHQIVKYQDVILTTHAQPPEDKDRGIVERMTNLTSDTCGTSEPLSYPTSCSSPANIASASKWPCTGLLDIVIYSGPGPESARHLPPEPADLRDSLQILGLAGAAGVPVNEVNGLVSEEVAMGHEKQSIDGDQDSIAVEEQGVCSTAERSGGCQAVMNMLPEQILEQIPEQKGSTLKSADAAIKIGNNRLSMSTEGSEDLSSDTIFSKLIFLEGNKVQQEPVRVQVISTVVLQDEDCAKKQSWTSPGLFTSDSTHIAPGASPAANPASSQSPAAPLLDLSSATQDHHMEEMSIGVEVTFKDESSAQGDCTLPEANLQGEDHVSNVSQATPSLEVRWKVPSPGSVGWTSPEGVSSWLNDVKCPSRGGAAAEPLQSPQDQLHDSSPAYTPASNCRQYPASIHSVMATSLQGSDIDHASVSPFICNQEDGDFLLRSGGSKVDLTSTLTGSSVQEDVQDGSYRKAADLRDPDIKLALEDDSLGSGGNPRVQLTSRLATSSSLQEEIRHDAHSLAAGLEDSIINHASTVSSTDHQEGGAFLHESGEGDAVIHATSLLVRDSPQEKLKGYSHCHSLVESGDCRSQMLQEKLDVHTEGHKFGTTSSEAFGPNSPLQDFNALIVTARQCLEVFVSHQLSMVEHIVQEPRCSSAGDTNSDLQALTSIQASSPPNAFAAGSLAASDKDLSAAQLPNSGSDRPWIVELSESAAWRIPSPGSLGWGTSPSAPSELPGSSTTGSADTYKAPSLLELASPASESSGSAAVKDSQSSMTNFSEVLADADENSGTKDTEMTNNDRTSSLAASTSVHGLVKLATRCQMMHLQTPPILHQEERRSGTWDDCFQMTSMSERGHAEDGNSDVNNFSVEVADDKQQESTTTSGRPIYKHLLQEDDQTSLKGGRDTVYGRMPLGNIEVNTAGFRSSYRVKESASEGRSLPSLAEQQHAGGDHGHQGLKGRPPSSEKGGRLSIWNELEDQTVPPRHAQTHGLVRTRMREENNLQPVGHHGSQLSARSPTSHLPAPSFGPGGSDVGCNKPKRGRGKLAALVAQFEVDDRREQRPDRPTHHKDVIEQLPAAIVGAAAGASRQARRGHVTQDVKAKDGLCDAGSLPVSGVHAPSVVVPDIFLIESSADGVKSSSCTATSEDAASQLESCKTPVPGTDALLPGAERSTCKQPTGGSTVMSNSKEFASPQSTMDDLFSSESVVACSPSGSSEASVPCRSDHNSQEDHFWDCNSSCPTRRQSQQQGFNRTSDYSFKAAIASGLKSPRRLKMRRTSAGVRRHVMGPEFSPQISDTRWEMRMVAICVSRANLSRTAAQLVEALLQDEGLHAAADEVHHQVHERVVVVGREKRLQPRNVGVHCVQQGLHPRVADLVLGILRLRELLTPATPSRIARRRGKTLLASWSRPAVARCRSDVLVSPRSDRNGFKFSRSATTTNTCTGEEPQKSPGLQVEASACNVHIL
eukprot:SM000389S14644  [mRNA]  locus=s389:25127:36829:- [translate_table: standard]